MCFICMFVFFWVFVGCCLFFPFVCVLCVFRCSPMVVSGQMYGDHQVLPKGLLGYSWHQCHQTLLFVGIIRLLCVFSGALFCLTTCLFRKDQTLGSQELQVFLVSRVLALVSPGEFWAKNWAIHSVILRGTG